VAQAVRVPVNKCEALNSNPSANKKIIIITNAKRAEGMAQVVKGLPSKCKALSSTPSTAKKQKQKNYNEMLPLHLFRISIRGKK
jgi:hypothetical protein